MMTATDQARPIFPLSGVCECGVSDQWYLVEHGYTRFSVLEVTPPEDDSTGVHLHGITNGWDDMSEGGDGEEYILCMTCDRKYASQSVEDWD